MKYYEDDSHKIPEYIRNMSPEEVEQKAAEYAEELRKEKQKRLKNRLASA
jgi:DNA-directed RNA polymerase alpha subunit